MVLCGGEKRRQVAKSEEKVGKSGEKWGKNGENWQKVVKSS